MWGWLKSTAHSPLQAGAATLLVALTLLLGGPAGAQAATTYTVNTLADNLPSTTECQGAAGDCSLRQALDKAQSGDTVLLPANGSPYVLLNSKIPVSGGISIVGAGATATTISGAGKQQAFELLSGSMVTMSNLTITGTHNPLPKVDEGGAITGAKGGAELTLEGVTISNSDTLSGYGGAIEIASNLVVRHSRFVNDSVTHAAEADGGGAIDLNPGGSSLTISDSVFANDSQSAGPGGAVLVEGKDVLNVTSSTFTSNIAGGGFAGGAIDLLANTTATIANSTFSGNAAGLGGGIFSAAKQLTLVNDTLAGNAAEVGANVDVTVGTATTQNTIFAEPFGPQMVTNCAGALTSQGHNLEDAKATSCGLSPAAGDLVGVDPGLAPPAENSSQDPTAGGPPQTRALETGSPALGAGAATGCLQVGSVDERAFPRPGAPGAGCDIGAYELLSPVPTSTTLVSSQATSLVGRPVTLSAAVVSSRSLPGSVPMLGGTVEFRDGGATIGAASLDGSGHAALTTSALAVGAHNVTAVYSGDAIYSSSISAGVGESVLSGAALPRPSVTGLGQTHKVWREGRKLARIARSHRPPVGTTFSFRLNVPATVLLTFKRVVGGRLAGRRCVAQTRQNTRRRACRRSVTATLTITGARAGVDRIAFEGRLSRSRWLARGRYSLVITARNTSGASSSKAIAFTIVRG